MKKYILIFLSLILIYCQAIAQTPEETFLEVLDFSKVSSPFSNQINWDDIKTRGLDFIKDKPANCAATAAIANILIPPLYRLDHHTFVTLEGLNTGCPLPETQELSQAWIEWYNLDQTIKNPIINYSEHFHGKRIGDYAYIYIPAGFAWEQEAINNKIKEGRHAFYEAQVSTAKGIILDFRHNYGGNNVPMLLSLSALLPEDVLFKFSQDTSISLGKGGNKLMRKSNQEIMEYGRFDSSIPVNKITKPTTILITGITGSSGAISAFALKNAIAQSLIVGEPSDDTLSVNESKALPDGNYFNLMVERIYSQDNILAPLKLEVDEYVEHDYGQMFSETDTQILKAISILNYSAYIE